MASSDAEHVSDEETIPAPSVQSNIEDRILAGELGPANNYISDSEDEDDAFFDASNLPVTKGYPGRPGTSATGPKGVIQDYREYQHRLALERQLASEDLVAQARRLTLQAKAQEEDDQSDEDNEKFLREYRQKRITEMTQRVASRGPQFGQLQLIGRDEYLDVIDDEDENVYVVIHLYKEHIHHCQGMNEILSRLAKQYTHVKFCAIKANEASSAFRTDEGLPALLVYQAGDLVANLVNVVEELRTGVDQHSVHYLLASHGVLPPPAAPANSNVLDEDEY